jgi:Tfp pilus assembly protein PilV
MKQMLSHRESAEREGFTLVEVLITGLLGLALILPLSRIAYTVVRNTHYAEQSAEALAAGQSQLELLEAMDYSAITSGSTTSGDYTVAWTSTTVSGAKQVQMTVSWELAGETRTLTLNTVYVD